MSDQRFCPTCHVGVPAGTAVVWGATLWCPHCDHEMGTASETEARPKPVDAAAQRARMSEREKSLEHQSSECSL